MFRLLRLPPLNWSFNRWMLVIQLLASLPVMVLAGWLTHRLVQEREAQQLLSLQRRTDVAATTLARGLGGAQVALRGLLMSEAGQAGDPQALRRLSLRALAADGDLADVSALRPDGRRLFTAVLPDQAVAHSPSLPATSEAVQAPTWLPLGPPDHADRVRLVTPWPAAGPDVLLCVTLRRAVLASVLQEQRWPDDWTVSVVDGAQRILARSRDEARYLGHPVTPALQAHLQAQAPGLLRSPTLAGVPSLNAVARIPGTDWWVVVALPAAALEELTQRPLRNLLWGGLAAGFLGSLAAFLLSRSLVRQVVGVATPDSHTIAFDAGPKGVLVRELQHIRRQQQNASHALHQAQHDTLTGLSRRTLFITQLQALLQASQHDPSRQVGVVFIDLDGFKAVNDQDGHAEGDRLLASFGRLLRSRLRAADPVCRLGGDEFVLARLAEPVHLLPTLQNLAHQLLDETPHLAPGLSCSIGLAVAEPGETPDQLLERADQAMFTAKRAGKSRVAVAEPR